MKNLLLFAVLVSLPLLLWGCGEKAKLESVNHDELEERRGIAYLKDSETPYTGKVFTLRKNGKKWWEKNYKDGKRDGLVVEWHENGKKRMEKNWKDGKRNGLQEQWYENGQKMHESNFKDGETDGLVVFWHANGQKQREANYKDGVEISAKFWNNKGELISETFSTPKD